MRLLNLIIMILGTLIMYGGIIYAINNNKIFAVLVFIIGGGLISVGLYLIWLDLFPNKPKKDKIIKDYSPE